MIKLWRVVESILCFVEAFVDLSEFAQSPVPVVAELDISISDDYIRRRHYLLNFKHVLLLQIVESATNLLHHVLCGCLAERMIPVQKLVECCGASVKERDGH